MDWVISKCLRVLWFPLKVMKRVRTEQIQMAVSCYLKRRQYVDSDGPLKQGLRLSQTAEEMAANLTGNQWGHPRAGWSRRTPAPTSPPVLERLQQPQQATLHNGAGLQRCYLPFKATSRSPCHNPSCFRILSAFLHI